MDIIVAPPPPSLVPPLYNQFLDQYRYFKKRPEYTEVAEVVTSLISKIEAHISRSPTIEEILHQKWNCKRFAWKSNLSLTAAELRFLYDSCSNIIKKFDINSDAYKEGYEYFALLKRCWNDLNESIRPEKYAH